MLELELDHAEAVLAAFNPDTKKNESGSEEPITVLRFTVGGDADMLAFFGPKMKDEYFKAGPKDMFEGGLMLADPNAVFPHKRAETMTGALLEVDYGVGGAMPFPDAVLDKFAITPMNGGKVIFAFDVTIRPDEGQVGKLYFLQKKVVHISLKPAEAPKMAEAA
jgi:hypothetical protein